MNETIIFENLIMIFIYATVLGFIYGTVKVATKK